MGKKKKEVPDTLANAIDQLAMQTIMVEADDVMTLGAILEHLETIEKLTQEGEFQPARVISRAVKNWWKRSFWENFQTPRKVWSFWGAECA